MRDYHYAPRTCLASIPGLLECWPQVKLGAHWLPGTTEYIIYYHCLVYGTGAQRINTETIAISKTMYITYTHNTNTHTQYTHTAYLCREFTAVVGELSRKYGANKSCGILVMIIVVVEVDTFPYYLVPLSLYMGDLGWLILT